MGMNNHLRGAVFFALCCLGKIPGGAPFSQLHKSGNGSRVDRPELAKYKDELNNKMAASGVGQPSSRNEGEVHREPSSAVWELPQFRFRPRGADRWEQDLCREGWLVRIHGSKGRVRPSTLFIGHAH